MISSYLANRMNVRRIYLLKVPEFEAACGGGTRHNNTAGLRLSQTRDLSSSKLRQGVRQGIPPSGGRAERAYRHVHLLSARDFSAACQPSGDSSASATGIPRLDNRRLRRSAVRKDSAFPCDRTRQENRINGLPPCRKGEAFPHSGAGQAVRYELSRRLLRRGLRTFARSAGCRSHGAAAFPTASPGSNDIGLRAIRT